MIDEVNPPCTGVLMIKGTFYACDWPTDANGRHDGWAHANKQAQALWADAPTVVDIAATSDRQGYGPR